MSVRLRHPRTGEIKLVPQGWSWSCCLGCGILGLPLYRRGLQACGSLMLVFNIVATIVMFVPTERAAALDGWLAVVGGGLCVWFGCCANRMTLDRCLAMGWEYADAGRPRSG